MKTIKKHSILSFVLLTYLITWSIWGIGYLLYKTNLNLSTFGLIVTIGSFTPSIMGILFTFSLKKKEGLFVLLKRLNPLNHNWQHCILGTLYIIIYDFFLFSLYYLFSNANFKQINFQSFLINLVFILLLGGPLGEEIGWRGFLLENIRMRFNQFFSSIIVGFIWTFWHLPMYFISFSSQSNFPLFLFLLHTILLSIVITTVYSKTNKCLTFSIIIHAISNTTMTTLLNSNTEPSTFYSFLKENEFILATIFIIIILLIGKIKTKKAE
ncbi:MAG: type II CAAX endopeptidase family protein [Clostridiaceae bacterium]|nr:type II CAAX endopeptidase family protein [Clostridiaceae bacterium]